MSIELWREFELPNSAAWAVYGDQLQERGDPRGRLIALEQRREAMGDNHAEELTEEIEALYHENRQQWLPDVIDRIESPEHGLFTLSWRYGYLRSVHAVHYDHGLEVLADVLRSPGAMYLAEFHENTSQPVVPLIELLADDIRPWRRCSITSNKQSNGRAGAQLCQRFAKATPHLTDLSLSGHDFFATLRHERLDRLRLSGASISDFSAGTALPNLNYLDLAVHVGSYEGTQLTARQCNGEGLPVLRTLDLSRNIRHSGTRGDPVFGSDCLFESPLVRRIERLILPPFYEEKAAERCVQHAAVLAAISKIEVPRVLTYHYDPRPMLSPHLPDIRFGMPYPFRLEEEVHSREVIEFVLHDGYGDWFSFARLSGLVEAHYEKMSERTRSAIIGVMEAFDSISYGDDSGERYSETLPLSPILAAFEEIGEASFEECELKQLFDYVVGHRSCCTEVTLRKVWGW